MVTKQDVVEAAKETNWNPVRILADWGVRPGHAYTAGFVAVGLSIGSWLVSRGKNDSRAQSDRWGLFVGEWAPTFFAIGIALTQEEGSKS